MGAAYLALENGRVFEGESCGAEADLPGELVFHTGSAGYVETLSDPCLYGQIVIFTFPQIGNCGWIPEDMVSGGCRASGVVLRDLCETPSNFRSRGTLDAFLRESGVPGIRGVDTRELTQIIRENGVMNAVITRKKPEGALPALKDFKIKDAVAAVCPDGVRIFEPEGEKICDAALINYGAGEMCARELAARGAGVTMLPYDAKAEDILKGGYDGLLLSGGPGSPADCPLCIAELSKLFGKLPIFGIGLGHQLLAMAAGAKTEKLKYGHRGANQPVRELKTGRIYITDQNHGYAVNADSLKKTGAELCYVNLNDNSCEGLLYPDRQAFSLQFFPDSDAWLKGIEFNFDSFVKMMIGGRSLCQ